MAVDTLAIHRKQHGHPSVDWFVVQPPPTRYVERDGVSITYQVIGDAAMGMRSAAHESRV
jgi:hypothetical protein